MEQLEPLPPADVLNDYRQADEGGTPLWLPHNQGDAFQDIDMRLLTGDDRVGHVMLFLHPCTMRKGAVLADRMTVIEVEQKSSRKAIDDPAKWATDYSVIPLPDFSGAGHDAYVGVLSRMGTIPTSALDRAKRVAALSDIGRSHMLHRIIYYLTRLAVPTLTLQEATAKVQAELQYQADWTYKASQSLPLTTEELVRQIETEFQARLDQPQPGGATDSAIWSTPKTTPRAPRHTRSWPPFATRTRPARPSA